METSIGLFLRGGLGNQLFQIFTLISKALDINKDFYIVCDTTDKRPLCRNIFNSIIDKIHTNNFNIDFDDPNIYNEEIYREYSIIPKNKSFIIGHFENPKYFNHNRNKIINILKLNELQFKYKFEFKKAIAIHFRFEDFIDELKVQKPSFYINAINKLKEEIKDDFYNYKFIIFSSKGKDDDYLTDNYIKEINENLEIPIDFIKFKDLYSTIETEEEFLYMSNCNYFIIPNSTFSWFAYYLSPFDNKKAIGTSNMKNLKLDTFIIMEE